MTRVTDLALTLWRGFVIFILHFLLVLPSVVLVATSSRGGAIGHALFARFWGRATLAGCGVRLETEGLEHVDASRPCILVSNHSSEMDFYGISAAIDLQWRALMRPGLSRIPLYGWVARRTGHVFLSQRDPAGRAADFARALAQLEAGHSLLVFAEGARSFDGKLRPLKRGAFLLALEAGVPVLPITIEEVLSAPRRQVLGRALAHRIERLRLIVHAPISPVGLDETQLAERTADAMRSGLLHPDPAGS